MKRVLTFTALSVFTYAMTWGQTVKTMDSTDCIKLVKAIDELSCKPWGGIEGWRKWKAEQMKQHFNIGAFIYLWDQYSKECCADSTWDMINEPHNYNGYNLSIVQYGWIRKQPTFPDFMEWLKQKVNHDPIR